MAAKLSKGGSGRYDLGQNSDINVTPFVDVMLVLLIIFMVAVPVATVSIRVDLPPALTTDNPPKDPIYVSVHAQSVSIVDAPSSTEYLAGDLARRFAGQGKTNPTEEVVMIRADGDVRYEQFMNILNTLQDAGYYKVGLISEDLA